VSGRSSETQSRTIDMNNKIQSWNSLIEPETDPFCDFPTSVDDSDPDGGYIQIWLTKQVD
jgi:hypothetical protein